MFSFVLFLSLKLYETINNVIETNDQTEINQLIQNLDINDMEELIDLEIETKEKK